MRIIIGLLLVFCCTPSLKAQSFSTTGTRFQVSFFINGFSSAPDVRLYLVSKKATRGRIFNPNTGTPVLFEVGSNSVREVRLSSSLCVNSVANTVNNLGLVVESEDSIAVFARNYTIGSEDVTLILPDHTLSTRYIVKAVNGSALFAGVFLVQATAANTVVEVTPASALTGGQAAGQPFTITLNQGQTYLAASTGDLTGSTVRVANGCKPVAVFCGAPAVILPATFFVGAEHLYEQLLPDYMLGKKFITPVLSSRNTSLVKLFAPLAGTEIFVNGDRVAGPLQAGAQFTFQTNNTPQYIETNFAVQVSVFGQTSGHDNQFGPANLGDPSYVQLAPLDAFVNEAAFSAPPGIFYPLNAIVSVACKTTDTGSIFLNGSAIGSRFRPLAGNSAFSEASITVDSTFQLLTGTGGGFQAYVSAASFQTTRPVNGATGYAFGTAFAVSNITNHFDLNSFSSNDTLTATTCVGSSLFRVWAPQPAATFSWNFGDGSAVVTRPGTVIEQAHRFATPGTYLVQLTIADTCGPFAVTRQLRVNVLESLVPVVKIDRPSADATCANQELFFTATTQNTGSSNVIKWFVNRVLVKEGSLQLGPVKLASGDWVTVELGTTLSCNGLVTVADSVQVSLTPVFKPEVTVTTPATEVCPDSLVVLTASTPVTYSGIRYQWKVNNEPRGQDEPVFSYRPQNNDRVVCEITITDKCASPAADTSEVVVLTTRVNQPQVTINAERNNLCVGDTFRFSATPAFGGPNPRLEWLVNGRRTGVFTASFAAVLQNNDTVACILSSSLACVSAAEVRSNAIVARVNQPVKPDLRITAPATTICINDSVQVSLTALGVPVPERVEWYRNNTLVAAGNLLSVSIKGLRQGDSVVAKSLAGNCVLEAVSNKLVFNVIDNGQATVAISAPVSGVCVGENIVVTAVVSNEGARPVYNWRVNGQAVAANAPVLRLSNVTAPNLVQLELLSSTQCVAPVVSTLLRLEAFPLPQVGFARGDTVILSGNQVKLRPVVSAGSATIGTWQWTPATALSNALIEHPVASPLATTRYALRATDVNGCIAQAAFEVKVTGPLLMPTAFTPNGDGLNDNFSLPQNLFFDLQSFEVYNRWGQVVFQGTQTATRWDGRFKGQPLPSGIYVWKIAYKDAFTGARQVLNGTVMLIR